MIKHFSFDHKGGWYHYRVNYKKLNGFTDLRGYLDCLFKNCPNDYFSVGPRSSSLKFKLNGLKIYKVKGHEVCELTEIGLKENDGRYETEHSKVQVFMLEKDDKTIAVEVPIWLNHDEMVNYADIFKSIHPLTGHIDVLRLEDKKIWVWDYKPNAHKEKFASTQVYFYALMLSKRTGIDLDEFRCGYFDKECAFIFKPEKEVLMENQNILGKFFQ